MFLEIQAGEGGRESQACAALIQRMYLKFAERQRWAVTDVACDETPDGVRRAVWKLEGKGVDVLLSENGNHRFTRPSPFGNGKLHTSFVGVKVETVRPQEWPEVAPADVVMSFFKGSGPGGQHRNKTESGVRLVHRPTNTVVEAVSERSQHANRDIAWERLLSKLARREADARQQAAADRWNEQGVIGFGARRRSYKLDANLVKDERTGNEIRQVQKVLDGHLDLVGLSAN